MTNYGYKAAILGAETITSAVVAFGFCALTMPFMKEQVSSGVVSEDAALTLHFLATCALVAITARLFTIPEEDAAAPEEDAAAVADIGQNRRRRRVYCGGCYIPSSA